MMDLKKKYLPYLKEIFIIYTKYSGQIPKSAFKEYIENIGVNKQEIRDIMDICISDKMISYNYDEIFSKDEIDPASFADIQNQIIDDIEIDFIEEDNTQSKIKRKKLTIEDEYDLFDYISKKVEGNELEYFSIPEIINLLLNSLSYTKTEDSRVFIRLLIDTLEKYY